MSRVYTRELVKTVKEKINVRNLNWTWEIDILKNTEAEYFAVPVCESKGIHLEVEKIENIEDLTPIFENCKKAMEEHSNK